MRNMYIKGIAVIGLSALLLCGCSMLNNIEETETETETEDFFSSFATEDDLWDYLEETYPTVTYDDIQTGDYSRGYVIIDSVAQNVEHLTYSDYVSCDMYFIKSDGSYEKNSIWGVFFSEEHMDRYDWHFAGAEYLGNLQDNDMLRGCYFIAGDNSFGSKFLAIKKTGTADEETLAMINSDDSTAQEASSSAPKVGELTFSGESILDVTREDMVEGYDYIKDVYISVKESAKEIEITIQVPSATTEDTAKDAADSVVRYLAFMAGSTSDGYYSTPGGSTLGGIYDVYGLTVYVDDGLGNFNLYGRKETSEESISW